MIVNMTRTYPIGAPFYLYPEGLVHSLARKNCTRETLLGTNTLAYFASLSAMKKLISFPLISGPNILSLFTRNL
jgi:hypothetical protein